MPNVLAYHRPTDLDEAAKLLTITDHRALAGGTIAVPEARKQSPSGVEMVDLQALGLGDIESVDDKLKLGAMVRLGDLGDNELIPALIKDAATRELPSALRNQATIGGTVAHADADSILVAALLVHDTLVEIHQHPTITLDEYLVGDRDGLVTAVVLDPAGEGSIASTGRTPADTPIVAALARSTSNGPRLALTGVAATPIQVDPKAPTDTLQPPGDFRGSPEYRTHLASVLAERALGEIN